MSRKKDTKASRIPLASGVDRRQFIGAALGAGGLLASMGLGQYVRAQGASAPARLAPPPEPTVSQPAPLRDLKGKVAYITAASDGIGLGIARAASNAGMKVVIGYRHEERLKAANRRTGLLLAGIAALFFAGIILTRLFDDPVVSTAVMGGAAILFLLIAIGRHLRK